MISQDRSGRVAGLLRNTYEEVRPAGFFIAVNGEQGGTPQKPVATGFSHIDGGFLIRLEDRMREQLQAAGNIRINIRDRFGRQVADAGPFSLDEANEGVVIEVAVSPEQDRPIAKPFWNPFEALHRTYTEEINALQGAGIRDWRSFADEDLDDLSRRVNMPVERLAAFGLHAQMNTTVPVFDARAARMLAQVGIRMRSNLAAMEPRVLLRVVAQAAERGLVDLRGFERSNVGSWIVLARGWDLAEFFKPYEPAQIRDADRLIGTTLVPHNPLFSEIDHFIEAHYWAQLSAIAQLRAVMTSAGVYDLSSLAPFIIHGRQKIGPGYHFRPAVRRVDLLDDANMLRLMIAQGGGFAKVKTVTMQDYGIHIVPNPVTDAVILGPILQFVDSNAQLVIGKDVTNLIIVTESVDFSFVHKIVYEENEANAADARAIRWPA